MRVISDDTMPSLYNVLTLQLAPQKFIGCLRKQRQTAVCNAMRSRRLSRYRVAARFRRDLTREIPVAPNERADPPGELCFADCVRNDETERVDFLRKKKGGSFDGGYKYVHRVIDVFCRWLLW